MKQKLFIAAAAVALLGAMTSCKPTVEGYKAAYEAAQAQRSALEEDARLLGMTLEDGMRWHHVGNDSVLYRRDILAPLDGDSLPMKNFNVAVAAYKMNTNALAHASRLTENGLKARVLKNPAGQFFVIAAEYDSIAPTPAFIRDYRRSHPNDMYSGLPATPVVYVLRGASVR